MTLISVTKIVAELDARRVSRRAFFSELRVPSDTYIATKTLTQIGSKIGAQIVSEIGACKLASKKIP